MSNSPTYSLKSVDLSPENECDPTHSEACASAGVDPQDSEIAVSAVVGWRDCPDLDALGEEAILYAITGITYGRCVIVQMVRKFSN